MTAYVPLVNWTDQGARDVANSPKRLDAARKQLENMGAFPETALRGIISSL